MQMLEVMELCRQVHGRGKKPGYEICKLKDQKIAQELCLELRNRFQLLADPEGVEESWQEFRKGVDETSQKILGLQKKGKTNRFPVRVGKGFKNAVS